MHETRAGIKIRWGFGARSDNIKVPHTLSYFETVKSNTMISIRILVNPPYEAVALSNARGTIYYNDYIESSFLNRAFDFNAW